MQESHGFKLIFDKFVIKTYFYLKNIDLSEMVFLYIEFFKFLLGMRLFRLFEAAAETSEGSFRFLVQSGIDAMKNFDADLHMLFRVFGKNLS